MHQINNVIISMNVGRIRSTIIIIISGVLLTGFAYGFTKPEPQELTLDLSVTYVGNEGVLVEGNGKKVLIDGLHREYKPAYLHLPEKELTNAERGNPPFDDIDLLLVTHIHRDHFHPLSVGNYLSNNPDAILIGPRQMADSLEKQFDRYGEIASRVKAFSPSEGSRESIKVGEIGIDILRLPHGSKRFSWIENLGYLITINGKSVLHIGDAAMSLNNFIPFELDEAKIDVACLPYWYFLYKSGQQIIRDQLKAEHFIGLHIDPREAVENSKKTKQAFPEVVPFTELFMKFPNSN